MNTLTHPSQRTAATLYSNDKKVRHMAGLVNSMHTSLCNTIDEFPNQATVL